MLPFSAHKPPGGVGFWDGMTGFGWWPVCLLVSNLSLHRGVIDVKFLPFSNDSAGGRAVQSRRRANNSLAMQKEKPSDKCTHTHTRTAEHETKQFHVMGGIGQIFTTMISRWDGKKGLKLLVPETLETRALLNMTSSHFITLWAVPDVFKRFSLLSREGLWSHFWASTYPLYLIKGMGRQQPQSN